MPREGVKNTKTMGLISKEKLIDMSGSENFGISLITMTMAVVFSFMRGAGADIPEDAAQVTINAVQNMDVMTIIMVVIPNIWKPIKSFFKNGFPNFFTVLRASSNFRTQLAALVVGILGVFGVSLSPEGVGELIHTATQVDSLSFASISTVLMALFHAFNTGRAMKKPIKDTVLAKA